MGLGNWSCKPEGDCVKTGVYCPYCAAELFDPEAERCTSCGMFVAPELRAAVIARIPIAARAAIIHEHAEHSQVVGAELNTASPVSAVAYNTAPPELGRPWRELSFTESQQAKVVWQTIMFQSSVGLAVWGLAIIPLGRLAQMPYAWIPAGMAIVAGLFGISDKTRWWCLGSILAAIVAILAAGRYS